MILRQNWPTASLLATVGSLALIAVSCGDGGGSPVTPTPPVAATPPPSIEPPSSGGSGASACQLGEGNHYAPCEKGVSELWEYVEAAMNTLVQEQPHLFNLDVQAGDGTNTSATDNVTINVTDVNDVTPTLFYVTLIKPRIL